MSKSSAITALVLDKQGEEVQSTLRVLDVSELQAHAPEGANVIVRVAYSTLNYKDGLALNGRSKVVKSYPHVPGVDLVGLVEESTSPDWKPGDRVIATGFRIGEIYWGGFAQKAYLRDDWLVALPEGLSMERAMAIGTAGLTAMEAIIVLEEHGLTPDDGDILVTGAAGGVGSIAVAVLAALGYAVVASTGREETHDYLRSLGAARIIDRDELSQPLGKPLGKEKWGGAVDVVGGATLATIISTLMPRASVAATGLVAGHDLATTVIPFLLRGVNLLGIDPTMLPIERRRRAWSRLVSDLPMTTLDSMISKEGLSSVPELAKRILKGDIQGRVVIDVNA